MASSPNWRVKLIRETFFSHFDLRDYTKLSPDPLIVVDDSTPPIDCYLNQFKLMTANGEVQIGSRRCSCCSLRCIFRGDDARVIDNFRQDSSYHGFTKLLGTWASGDYKEAAIKLSWELLTKTYKLPRNKIYIKYFGGNTESCLDHDVESLDIWKRYVPGERILPSMAKAVLMVAARFGTD